MTFSHTSGAMSEGPSDEPQLDVVQPDASGAGWDFGAASAALKHSIPGDFNLIGVSDVELLLSETQMDVRR